MSQLSAQARRVLELARHEDDPNPGARQRVARSLAARISLGSAVVGGAAAIATPAAAQWAPTLVKVLLPLGVAGSLTGAGWLAWGPSSAPVSARSSVTVSARSVSQAAAASPASLTTSEQPSPNADPASAAATIAPVASPDRIVASADRAGPAPNRAGAAPPATSEARRPSRAVPRTGPSLGVSGATKSEAQVKAPLGMDPLVAETEALRAAQRALRSGDAVRAQQLLDQQELTYAEGSLHEERAAARILSLCQSGQAELARAQAERFARRWPRSALRARVLSACRERAP